MSFIRFLATKHALKNQDIVESNIKFTYCTTCKTPIFIDKGNIIPNQVMKIMKKNSLEDYVIEWDCKSYGHTNGVNKYHYYCDANCEINFNSYSSDTFVPCFKDYIECVEFKTSPYTKSPISKKIERVPCSVCRTQIAINEDNIIDERMMRRLRLQRLTILALRWSQTTSYGYFKDDKYYYFCNFNCEENMV
jgi:hypothetical protein